MPQPVDSHPASPQSPPQRFVGRWHYLLVACLCAAWLVYGSWLPFQFESLTFDDALRAFRLIWDAGLSPHFASQDVAVNVLITVPFAFALMGAILFRRRGAFPIIGALLLTACLCIALSVAVEFGQLWIANRVTSVRDIAAQSLGTAIGVILWLLLGPKLTDAIDDFVHSREPARRIEWLLHAYVIALVIWSLLPFDLATNLNQIARKFSTGQVEIVPFTFPYKSAVARWTAWLSDTLLYIFVGVWAATTMSARSRRVRSAPMAMAMCVLFAIAIESAQLLVLSRYPSSTDVICGTLGAAIGIAAAWRWMGERDTDPRERNSGRVCGIALLIAIGYSAMLLFVGWTPFEMTRDPQLIRQRLRGFADLPFRAMQASGGDTNSLFHTIGNFGWFLPLGGLLAVAVHRGCRSSRGKTLAIAAAGIALLALAVGIEAGQILIPERTPDLTESIVRTLGGWTGLVIATIILRRWSPSPQADVRA